MTDVFKDLHDMYAHYGFHELVEKITDPDQLGELMNFRISFLQEEMRELSEAYTAEDAVDALIDLVVVAVGTLDLFGVDGGLAWREVMNANMNKRLGIKENRPNPFGFPDLTKPEGWQAPDHTGNHGRMTEAY